MICAKTSLPWFIGGPRDGRHHGLANAPIRVEIETRSKHELSFTNQTVIAPLVLDVGTALSESDRTGSSRRRRPESVLPGNARPVTGPPGSSGGKLHAQPTRRRD